ncbi:hypothetical protein [Streptomyces litchfieldiae]|uniref:PH domain-containing protein n=1 Tax=Streptomyces litchfieldiae TaxID=3075543 RepID=A0ABU2MIV5_9ACTN|nr:hypothetical protein [Streptomyces sp. DSM 44938]MDT0341455.1 hypothetical protein [Streptomyces sp. DSM 44938]
MRGESTEYGHRHPGGPWPAPPQAGAAPLLLRPAARLRWAILVVAVVCGLVFLSPAGALGGAPALVATVVVETAACVLLWMRASRIRVVVTEHQIETIGVFRRRLRPRAEAAHVVRATLIPPRGMIFPVVFVLDARGRVIVRLNGGAYAPEDLDRLAGHLGLPQSGPDQPVTARQLTRTYPEIVPFFEARPILTGFAVAAMLVPVLMVVALIVALTSLR